MSNGWQFASIGDLSSPVQRHETPLPGAVYRQVGVRLWGQGAYERESIDGGETQYKTLNRVELGDIIVNKIWARNGSVSVIFEDTAGCYASGEFPLFSPDLSRLEPRWFYYITKTPAFWAECEEKSFGTSGKNRIRPEKFLEIEIPLPPLDEQRRIVAHIDALAARIAEARGLRQSALEEAEGVVTSLHLQLAQDRIVKLGQMLELSEKVEPVHASVEYRMAGVYSFGKGLFSKGVILGSDTRYTHFHQLFEGAVVLSQLFGWEGAVALCDAEFNGFLASKEFRTFRCLSTEVSPRYLRHLIPTNWFWSQLATLTTGMGDRRQRVKPDQFLNLELPMPLLEDQLWAIDVFERVHEYRAHGNDIFPTLDALLPSVLDRAFRGEL